MACGRHPSAFPSTAPHHRFHPTRQGLWGLSGYEPGLQSQSAWCPMLSQTFNHCIHLQTLCVICNLTTLSEKKNIIIPIIQIRKRVMAFSKSLPEREKSQKEKTNIRYYHIYVESRKMIQVSLFPGKEQRCRC